MSLSAKTANQKQELLFLRFFRRKLHVENADQRTLGLRERSKYFLFFKTEIFLNRWRDFNSNKFLPW